MVMRPGVDASEELGAWVQKRRARLDASGVVAVLRIGERAANAPSKALLELKRGDDLGAITVWANGMVDLDLLRSGAAEPQARTSECSSVEELTRVLDACFQRFLDAV
jgi:hypothetical protein